MTLPFRDCAGRGRAGGMPAAPRLLLHIQRVWPLLRPAFLPGGLLLGIPQAALQPALGHHQPADESPDQARPEEERAAQQQCRQRGEHILFDCPSKCENSSRT